MIFPLVTNKLNLHAAHIGHIDKNQYECATPLSELRNMALALDT
jgi:hypothetical protein